MIKSFQHRGLKRFFVEEDARQISPTLKKKLEAMLDALDTSETVQDMDVPGSHLHELKGERKGTWSVRISGNWRLTFQFIDGHAYDVNLEDYH